MPMAEGDDGLSPLTEARRKIGLLSACGRRIEEVRAPLLVGDDGVYARDAYVNAKSLIHREYP